MNKRLAILTALSLTLCHCSSAPKSTTVDMSQKNPKGTDADHPLVTSPEVRKVWVPDKIDGNKYISGHYMYIIERGSVWTMQ